MSALRALSLGLLSALILLTGVGAAMARGAMASDGVICGAGAFRVVLAADGLPLLDGNGAPVEAAGTPCLDCVFGHLALAPDSPDARAISVDAGAVSAAAPRETQGGLWRMGGRGRGPPAAA